MVLCLELKIQTPTRDVSSCVDHREEHQVAVVVQRNAHCNVRAEVTDSWTINPDSHQVVQGTLSQPRSPVRLCSSDVESNVSPFKCSNDDRRDLSLAIQNDRSTESAYKVNTRSWLVD